MTDELARVKPKSFHDKNAHPERYCVAIGCLEYEPCSIHLGPRMTDDELARVKRIGKPPESNIDQVLAWRTQNLELRAQKLELLAALRDMTDASSPSEMFKAALHANALIARIEATP